MNPTPENNNSVSNKHELAPTQNLLENSLVESLGEFALDSLLKDGVFKDIPGFSLLLAAIKAPKTWSDYQFQKNLKRFCKPLISISEVDKQTFLNRLENQEQFRQRVGKNLLLLLSQIDDIRKPELIGRVFGYLIKGKIQRFSVL
ncbi:hypothetical protein FEK30_05035 [Picosynechococcus sp. PCC 11901]|uniref:hypothetical protein n=1 Tax=Picosynechococcus sp. PCC 11901 TaxID=2579791 RepID=UPI0010FBCB10|nr:hypothetical protein [Picosynechococcus sp. PCC 11901]QCS48848.1 hypothetical protein FEK30_05035 [Picosynechococcus sp. PCC 11901]